MRKYCYNQELKKEERIKERLVEVVDKEIINKLMEKKDE